MSWRTTRLGDVMTLQRGHDLPDSKRQDGMVPVVSSSGITDRHKVPKAKAPGVVTGRYGTLGEVFYIEEDYWPLNTALYVTDFKGNHPRFAAYFLRSVLRNYQSDKAAVPGVNRNVLHELKVKCPDTKSQVRIAEILSCYDNLIDTNRRRIQLLEESARLLFREWFVYFRFPGHENVKIVDGMPEGWRKRRLVEVADFTMGQSPKSEYYNDNGEGLPFHQGVTGFGHRYPTNQTYCIQKNRMAQAGDILFSVRAPVGRINISTERIIIGRGLSAIRSKDNHQSYLFYELKNHFFKEDMIGGGAIFAAITKKDLETVVITYPDEKTIEQFENITNPIDRQIEILSNQNQKLAQARDLLLPRLMSGAIEV